MHSPNDQLLHFIEEALKEDIGSGDHSTLSCIPSSAMGKAVLKIKQPTKKPDPPNVMNN